MFCVENHQVVIVIGHTGCGKTTRTFLLCTCFTHSHGSQKFRNTFTSLGGLLEAES
jgi:HrpA-like RNA helicase